ncbi:hypothetical protein B0T11DRAFT_327029 [Plectosphaerella cucumerina]|uniref:C2H2-type domain-containing protein n=1 Tax=Plectosphaerella cucumerina TaxID=40658 RepID=A0A8K0TNL3_9PEZI|nr:hypothetical protein B0T11DRAFT_327029 [Plectosphaerella cucumerina]
MEGHGTWYGYGSAVPANPDLDGTSLFDSPLPELHEVSFDDDLGLGDDFALCGDLFDGTLESIPFGYTQGSFPPPSSGPNVGAYDANAELAACFDFDDPLLFPDANMDLDLALETMDFNFFGPGLSSQPVSSVDTSPFSRLSDASAMTAATSPASPHEAGAAAYPYRCTTDACTKTFRKESQLKQHQRVHKKSLVCPICRAERQTEHKFAQVRDLERHLQARHRDVAERANVRSETRECPHPGCEHRGRRDNVSRHYESKHGGKLKWRRGVPSVI